MKKSTYSAGKPMIIEFEFPDDLCTEPLRLRAKSAKIPCSRQYVLKIDGIEAGFLSFDYHRNLKLGVIYEIFVLPQFRHKGIGNALLLFAEQLAESLYCNRLTLTARSFDNSDQEQHLQAWYQNKGFKPVENVPDELEKIFSREEDPFQGNRTAPS